MKKLLSVALTVFLVMALVAGCGGKTEPEPTPAGKVAKDTIIILVASEPVSLDPLDVTNDVQAFLLRLICENLFVLDDKGMISEGLLESYSVYGTEFTGKLKEGILFSDGSEFTTEDLFWELNRLVSNENSSPLFKFLDMENSVKEDEYNFKLEFTQAWGPFTYAFADAMGSMVSYASYSELGWEAFEKMPVGTGPYKIESWEPGVEITFIRNELYRGEPAKTERIIVRFQPNSNERINDLKAGEADMDLSVLAGYMGIVNNIEGYKIVKGDSYGVYSLVFSTTDKILGTENVREAMCLAIDKADLVEAAGRNGGEASSGLVSPMVRGYISLDRWKQDTNKAKKLMQGASYASGFNLKIFVGEEEESFRIATYLQEAWQVLGINGEIVVNGTNDPTQPGVYIAKSQGAEISTALQIYTSDGDESLNALLLDLPTYYYDDARRNDVIKAICSSIGDNCYAYPIMTMQQVYGLREDLQGFVFYPDLAYLRGMEDWVIYQ